MGSFTYENNDRNEKLETYEWDNVWIDHADNPDARRVLYIGDSISCGTRHEATKKTNEELLFDGFGTSKGIDNPYFMRAVSLFAAQEGKREAVIFNNGLHGWHLDDETEYKNYYEEMIKALLKEFSDTPLYIVLTTYVTDAERANRVIVRNKVAAEIAKKYSLPVIDLYSVSLKHKDLISSDGVHFSKEGYEKLAEEIIKSLNNA